MKQKQDCAGDAQLLKKMYHHSQGCVFKLPVGYWLQTPSQRPPNDHSSRVASAKEVLLTAFRDEDEGESPSPFMALTDFR